MTDARMIKMIKRTSSTSVNGVMLIVAITSSSPAPVETAILRRHEPDVFNAGQARRVENADDRCIGRLGVSRDRDVNFAAAADRLRHEVVNPGLGRPLTVDEDAAALAHLDVDLILLLMLLHLSRGRLVGQLLLESRRRS